MDLEIIIPSWKRADKLLSVKGFNTLRYIGPAMMDRTKIAVRVEEEEAYMKVSSHFGCGITSFNIPPEAGIVETRDKILAFSETEYLVMIDDDLKFATRSLENKYTTFDDEGQCFGQMIINMMSRCDEYYPIVGITARQFSNNKPLFSEDTRIIQLFCFHMPTIRKEDMWFGNSGMTFMSDYYFTLSMLQRGYHNLVLNTYTRDERAQAPGGCSEYRTVELYNESAKELYRKFPGLVRLEWKENGAWKEPRLTPHISWRKAYNGK